MTSTSTPAGTSPVHEMFAYLCVRDTAAAIDFYTRAFGATERYRLTEPSGRIGHAELQLGPAVLMLADEFPECGFTAPPPEGLPSVVLHLHVDNADTMGREAVAAGATMLSEPTDQFYGERSCKVRDPFGHTWLLGHSIEAVSPQEMQRRYDAAFETG
jgi:PhnB protein